MNHKFINMACSLNESGFMTDEELETVLNRISDSSPPADEFIDS